jgi:hypothetical protein
MSDREDMDVSATTPPQHYSAPLKALWWLKKGNLQQGAEWDQAHEICQSAEGEADHDWIHALCHLIEGDHGNAAYWFGKAGKPSRNGDPAAVWKEIADALT